MSSLPIQQNVSLKHLNTFHIDVKAKYFAELNSINQLQTLISEKIFIKNNLLILGGGSNILFTKDFDGFVLRDNLKGIDVIGEDDDYAWVRSAGGELWHTLVLFCIEKNLGGIENLSLIPGSVGASPIQNIGAYGVELKETLERVDAVSMQTGNTETFTNADCRFAYRNSIFKNELKNKYFITSLVLKLNKKPIFNTSYGAIQHTLEKMGVTELSVKAISDAVISIRKTKLPDPEDIGNAGSFFKNPEIEKELFRKLKSIYPEMPGYASKEKVKIAAAWLIEQCGWKGKRAGNAGVHTQQALVLVNHGNATGKEIYNLAMQIKESVMEKFGIEINPEVNII